VIVHYGGAWLYYPTRVGGEGSRSEPPKGNVLGGENSLTVSEGSSRTGLRYNLVEMEKSIRGWEPKGGKGENNAYVAKKVPDADGEEGRQRGMGHHRRQRKSLGASSPDLISARTSCAHLKGCSTHS
jgi:hypothetical protein